MAAPDRSKRTKPRGVEDFKRLEIGIERLAAFHMQDGGKDAVRHGLADFGCRPAEPPAAVLVEPMGDRRHLQGNVERRDPLQRRIEWGGIVSVRIRFAQVEVMRRWNVDGAEAAGEPTFPRARSIDMPGARSIAELSDRIAALVAAAPEAQENIVVTVED